MHEQHMETNTGGEFSFLEKSAQNVIDKHENVTSFSNQKFLRS
jgi:hypothetical protein